ncbi:MAG: FxsA family protein [Epsilonproteobacteria bacterium]|nr:FxsA family protein [Campylobacterota bacterium]
MVYFLVYLFLEITVTLNIAKQIGSFATFIEVILSALVGFIIIANLGNSLSEGFRALLEKRISEEEFTRLNIFMLIGAILLIVPGFLSDIVGVLFQFPYVALMITRKFYRFKKDEKRSDDVIDVEVIDDLDK